MFFKTSVVVMGLLLCACGNSSGTDAQQAPADTSITATPLTLGPYFSTTGGAFNGASYEAAGYANGVYFLAGGNAGIQDHVTGARFDRNGTNLDPAGINIGPMDSYNPVVVSSGSQFLVAWAHSPNIQVARVLDDGTVLDPTPLTMPMLPGSTSSYYIGLASNGTDFFVVWGETLSNQTYSLRGAIVRANGQLGPSLTIALNTDGYDPDVAFVGGVYLAVFTAPAGNNQHTIRAARVDTSGSLIDSSSFLIAGPSDVSAPVVEAISGSLSIVSWYGASMYNYARVDLAGAPTVGMPLVRGAGGGFPSMVYDGVSLLTVNYTPATSFQLTRIDPFTDPPSVIETGSDCGATFATDGQGTTLCVNSSGAQFITDLANGKGCLLNAECGSGHCVDGFCCDTVCGGNVDTDCQVCSVAKGAPANGTCGIAPAAHVCRTAAGSCDAPESCDGVSAECPQDSYLPPTAVCRGINGPCDVIEKCTGASVVCPVDKFLNNTNECRPATSGGCDVAESCTGTAAACPNDVFKMPGTSCRASVGPCDSAEVCSGGSPNCPADVVADQGTPCRPASGGCDVAEECDGATSTCPADGFAGAGFECRPIAGPCDLAESCSGGSALCPTDTFKPSTTPCRAAAGMCDQAESCTGNAAACPADAKLGPSVTCRPANGDCDVPEKCNNVNVDCPADGVAPPSMSCRSPMGLCDLAENCDGTTKVCPADMYKAVGTTCHPSSMGCDPAETCDGTAQCPQDIGCNGPVDAGMDGAGSPDGGGGGGGGGGNNPGGRGEDPYASGQGCAASGGSALLPALLAILGLCVRRRRRIAAFAMIAALSATAGAQPAPKDAAKVEAARAHFRQGKAFLDQKLYDDAIREFDASYRLVPLPELIFNIAQANRFKGANAEALLQYQKYLAASPNGRGADKAREYIAELTRLVREDEARKQAEAQKLADEQKLAAAKTEEEKAEAQKRIDEANKAEAERLEAERIARDKQQAELEQKEREAEQKRVAAAAEVKEKATPSRADETQLHRGIVLSAGASFGAYDAPASFENAPSATAGAGGVIGWYVSTQVALVAEVHYESVFDLMTFNHVTAGGGVAFPMGGTLLRITGGVSVLSGAGSTITGFNTGAGLTIRIAGPVALTIDGNYAVTGTPTVVGGSMGLAYAMH